MKVGDVVKQNRRLVEFDGKNAPTRSGLMGIVLEITDRQSEIPPQYTKWGKWLGRSVIVLWSSGRLSKSLAENSLDVINESW